MTRFDKIDLIKPDAVELDAAALRQAITDATAMADAAREVILPYFRRVGQIDNKLAATADTGRAGFDPVTRADREAELAIVDVIRQLRPDDGVYGEEFGYQPGNNGLCWVLDPIDGTRGFICGLTTWGTLIALHNGKRSIVGVMDQPVLRERFIGSAFGAELFSDRGSSVLSASKTVALNQALMCTTSPEIFTDCKQVLDHLVSAVATTRYGTDCYGYAMLAAGMIDLVVEANLQTYDIQALIPIIEAAGGVITDWAGQPVRNDGNVVAACTRELHSQALEAIASVA